MRNHRYHAPDSVRVIHRLKLKTFHFFTLIELLVVVAIIAILASLLLPALQMAKQSAISADCMSRFRQMGMAIFQYKSDNDEFYPVNWVPEHNMDWLTQIGPYIDPNQTNYRDSNGMWNSKNSTKENLFLCPASGYQPGHGSPTIYARWATIDAWRVHNYHLSVYFGWHNLTVHPEGSSRKDFDAPAEKMAMMGEIYGSNRRWPRYDARWVIVSGLFRHPGDSTNLLLRDGHVQNVGNVGQFVTRINNGEIIVRPRSW